MHERRIELNPSEIIKPLGMKVNLLEPIDSVKLQHLKDLIAIQEHTLPFFVHPLYNAYKYGTETLIPVLAARGVSQGELPALVDMHILKKIDSSLATEKRTELKKYLSTFFTWLASCPYKVIGIAEEDINDNKTMKILRQYFKGEIVYYPTWLANPHPAFRNYHHLSKLFIDLKIEKLMFGGQLGIYPQNSEVSDPNFKYVSRISTEVLFDVPVMDKYRAELGKQCVAEFIQGIVQGIQVEMGHQQLSVAPIHTLMPLPLMSK